VQIRHIAGMGEMRNAYKILVGKLEGIHFGDLGVVRNIILK
jgi:hypothetical protein